MCAGRHFIAGAGWLVRSGWSLEVHPLKILVQWAAFLKRSSQHVGCWWESSVVCVDVQEGEILLGEVVSDRAERGSFRRLWVPAAEEGKWKCTERWQGMKDQQTALGTACTIFEYYKPHTYTPTYTCMYVHMPYTYTQKFYLSCTYLYTHLHNTTPTLYQHCIISL